MSRGLASDVLAELYSASTSGVWLALLTIEHADLAATRRYVRNTVDITSRSNTYTAAGFRLELPDETGDTVPQATVHVDVVNLQTITDIRAITFPPADVTIEIIRASDPDTVLRSWKFQGRVARYNALTCSIELSPEPILDEPFPGWRFTPKGFPGMFKR